MVYLDEHTWVLRHHCLHGIVHDTGHTRLFFMFKTANNISFLIQESMLKMENA